MIKRTRVQEWSKGVLLMGRFEWFGTGCWLLHHNGVGAILELPPYSPDLMPVERLWSWLRQTLGYLHCHSDEAELEERIAAFVEALLDAPGEVHRRLVPKLQLDPAVEKLRGSV